MLNPQLSILVVDDTKFSSAVIGHTLTPGRLPQHTLCRLGHGSA